MTWLMPLFVTLLSSSFAAEMVTANRDMSSDQSALPHTNSGNTLSIDGQISIMNEINRLQEDFASEKRHQNAIIKNLQHELGHQKKINAMYEAKFDAIENKGKNARDEPAVASFSIYGCDLDILQLNCSGGKTINVTSAYYGQYSDDCSDCCAPHPTNDCTQHMFDVRPTDWFGLKSTCDNQTSCEYQNLGALVGDCNEPYYSDYLIIYYSCLPETAIPVAFTAYPTQKRSYISGDIVIFDGIETNLGDFYQVDSSIFLCPYDGVYVFTLSIREEEHSGASFSIYKEGKVLASIYSKDALGHSSATAIVECEVSERVWVESNYLSDVHGDNAESFQRYSMFSGFLLNAY